MTIEEKSQAIRDYFKSKGMRQTDVARVLGVSRATVCNLMSGAPFGKRTAYEWSKTFGFSKDFLVNGVEPVYEEDKGRECLAITQNITGNSGIAVQQTGGTTNAATGKDAPVQTEGGSATEGYFARLCSELLQRVIDKDNEIQALRNEISRMKNEGPGHANQDSK